MSFIVKNSQLNNEAIEMLNSLIELDINATAAFKLTRIMKEISSIVEDKVSMEKKILDKWIEKDEGGNIIRPKDENGELLEDSVNITDIESFTNEMNNLMSVENTIPFDKIDFEDLNLKTSKIKDLVKIEFLFN